MRVFGKGEWKNSLREGSYVSTIVKQEALVKTPKCDSRSVFINSSKDLCHTGLKKLTCIYNRLLLQGKGRGLYKCWHEAKLEVMFLQESIFVPSSHLLDVTVNTWYKTISNEALVCVCVSCVYMCILPEAESKTSEPCWQVLYSWAMPLTLLTFEDWCHEIEQASLKHAILLSQSSEELACTTYQGG